MLEVHLDSDMLNLFQVGLLEHLLCNSKCANKAFFERDVLPNGEDWGVIPSLRFHRLEVLCGVNNAVRIELSVSELVIVSLANLRSDPILVLLLNWHRRIDGEVLKITPCKIRTNREDKGVDTSSKGSRGRSSSMSVVTTIRTTLTDIRGVLRNG